MESTIMEVRKREQESQSRAFEARAQQFFEDWSPGSPQDDAAFHRDLMMLVRTIYQDAQAPLLDHITKIVSMIPSFQGIAATRAGTTLSQDR